MPRERKPQFDVLSALKELTDEADHAITENLNRIDFSGLDAWFDAVKDTVLKIKNCESVAGIEYPPHMSFFLGEEFNKNKKIDTAVTSVQREHVHATVKSETTKKTAEIDNSNILPVSLTTSETKSSHLNTESNKKKMVAPATNERKTPANNSNALFKCSVVLHQINTPQMKNTDSSINALENNYTKSQNLMETPILNRTFNKAINKTLILDSNASSNSCQKTEIIDSAYNDSGLKTKSVFKNVSSSTLKNSGSGMLTRSGTKRRSSVSKSKKSSKKQKTEVTTTPASKSAKSRKPLADKNMKTAFTLSSENNSKVKPVIVPLVQKKQIIPKEKLIIEEIKKKDEKANENMKRILAERQMKAEQNKKSREERRARTLQKRIEMEKLKEERLQKAELEAKKSQAKPIKENAKNSIVKTRTQELIDQHVKGSIPGVLTASKQNIVRSEALLKTPAPKTSDDCESYELTPVPNSSTYNFSDDEDEKSVGKPIPLWAQGVHLRSALLHQYYNPPNLAELFGTEIESPDLAKIFSVQKKRYLKRTSSAVWNCPPSLKNIF